MRARTSVNRIAKLTWYRIRSYEKAKPYVNCVYLVSRKRKPVYIGRAKQFAGPSGRYAGGYRYLLDELLTAGISLHIGVRCVGNGHSLSVLERSLLYLFHKTKGLRNKKSASGKKPRDFVRVNVPHGLGDAVLRESDR
jgi:hypothetical protein